MSPIIISSFVIIIAAALIQASLQLSVSVLTLLGGSSLGKKQSHKKTLRLMNSFVLGNLIMTGLILSAVAYYLTLLINHEASTEKLIASIATGLMLGLGVAIWAIYYRKHKTDKVLWLPRNFADYLTKRAKSATSNVESLSLGLTSVIAEIMFIIGPVIASALAIVTLPNIWWKIGGIALYVILSLLSLMIIVALFGRGHSIATLQRWRENNRGFLQFASGAILIVLAVFIFVDRAIGLISYGGLW